MTSAAANQDRLPLPSPGSGTRRVLEIAHGVAGAFAGMFLAAGGFDVTRVVSQATGTRPAGFTASEYGDVGEVAAAFLHERKRVLRYDPDDEDSRASLLQAVAEADMLIEQLDDSERGRLGDQYSRAVAGRPELVVVRITPFGSDGPQAGISATELTVNAAGGWLQHIGDPGAGPIRPPGHQSEVMGGLTAVMSGVASLLQADGSGAGESIDIALRECVTWFQMNPTTTYSYSGAVGHRTGGSSDVNYPQGVFECANGLVGINVLYYVEWFRFCDLLGRADWKTDPRLETPLLRYENRDLIDEELLPWLAARTAAEIYAAGQAHKLPFGMVNGPAELLESGQLAARGFWRTAHLPDGTAVTWPEMPAVYTSEQQGAER